MKISVEDSLQEPRLLTVEVNNSLLIVNASVMILSASISALSQQRDIIYL